METPSFKEDHISQIPALQLLIKLGYQYLSPEEAQRMRGGKTSNVILESILRQQLKVINSIRVSSSRTTLFSDANIENGIQALKDLPMNEGYMAACETAYNRLTLGHDLEQNIDGDKKSFTLQYIDWKNPANNAFHVTEEYSVMRSTSRDPYIPDLVLFINGIPVCVIECKRPDMKDPVEQAISQHLRNQQEDGIRSLYVYAQLLLSLASHEAKYATNGTPEEYWSIWREKYIMQEEAAQDIQRMQDIKHRQLSSEEKSGLFTDRFHYEQQYFDDLEKNDVLPTEQDLYLYHLCRPERLMDLIFNFILFDNGEKKIARYQQYFVIQKTMRRIADLTDGKRKGGVVWHTQGSGKSLTMVMLAQAIVLNKDIRNPKIILVTDRIDLDDQITGTFRKCGVLVNNAATGQKLVEFLENNSDVVITTVINKFEAAIKKISQPLESQDIFVLVDEGHRTQHGTFNIEMQKTLPNACYIAFTGTPLFKKDKSTAEKFGGTIDTYTVDQAVKDKAVVPLLYEGRHARQNVNANPLDVFFDMVSEPLNDYQKADLKKKFARADQLNVAEQKIYAISWDISLHFRDNFQGTTPLKGQLVCQNKVAAIQYKAFLDEIGIVSTEVLISPPDEREGEESAYGETPVLVKQFWKKMMDEHGSPKKYQKNLINRFKKADKPEIIIVVDKLLTGFDEPKNTVLYLTRNLNGHTLLQAIARVNRIYPDKEYGYIIDYYGVIEQLDDALKLYSSFSEFDEGDLNGTLTNMAEEIRKLPQKHAELWDVFKTVTNRRDAEAYQVMLRDEALRINFYDKLAAFARILKLALSSIEFHKQTPEEVIATYKNDLAFFLKLRRSVIQRYSDTVDYRQFEGQIQKLIDTHITTEKVEPITSLVNIFDKEKFQEEVEQTTGKAARADKIASRTARHISEKMEEDPAFYKKFSQMLKDVISDYESRRIHEIEYLQRVENIMNNVLARTDSDIPDVLQHADVAKAFYGLTYELLSKKMSDPVSSRQISASAALEIDRIISGKLKVNWQHEVDIPKKMSLLIGDYFIDEIRDKYNLDLSFDEIDGIAGQCVTVAKIRYKR